jgi:hypothetical protein
MLTFILSPCDSESSLGKLPARSARLRGVTPVFPSYGSLQQVCLFRPFNQFNAFAGYKNTTALRFICRHIISAALDSSSVLP